jgi:hypothetical protein
VAVTPVQEFRNPFRPGAGHMPPYLAGRSGEQEEFVRLLDQDVILENAVLTGLRGVGKTVLLDTLKPLAVERDWLWVGTDLSESASVSEVNLAQRLLTDLSVVTSTVTIDEKERPSFGFRVDRDTQPPTKLDYRALVLIYENTPGLVEDKVKNVLETAWVYLQRHHHRGVIFAYDEAQNLADNAASNQYPLSLLLDVFQSLQKKDLPYLLVLTGLPTLFPKLVEARTFAERMFRVIVLNKLNDDDSKDAIVVPIKKDRCPVAFADESVATIIEESGGYPYFIQFICREVYDVFIQQARGGEEPGGVPVEAITRKLDSDFFAGRWARATDRQRELLWVISLVLDESDREFSVQEVVTASEELLPKPFSNSHVNQMLVVLTEHGLIYKNRHGRYSLAVPLLDRFVLRQVDPDFLDQRT